VDEGESPEQAAIREAMEELGVEVTIKQKVVEIQLGQRSRQIYFLVEQMDGEFGTGTGTEYTDSDPDNSEEGIYTPIWMPIDELSTHENIYPADVVGLVVRSVHGGWAKEVVYSFEEPK